MMPADRSGAGVQALVDALGSETVSLLYAPDDPPEVMGPRIFDPHDAASVAAGDFLLGVNLAPQAVPSALKVAAAAGVSGLALKGDSASLAAAQREAENCRVALVAVAPDVIWDQLHAIVLSATVAINRAGLEPAGAGDLFALANAIAALVGGAVAIEDPRSRLLAYSTLEQAIDEPRRQTILGRQNPQAWDQVLQDQGHARQLLTAPEGVIRIQDASGQARTRVASLIKAGSEILGSIWVVEGAEPLGRQAEESLREAVPLAAMHLLRHRAFTDSTRHERGELLRQLLTGAGSVPELGSALGLELSSPVALVAFELTIDDEVQLSVQRDRAIDLITLACEAFRRRVVCTWMDQTVYALFPAVTDSVYARLPAMAEEICLRATPAGRVRAGVSSVGVGLAAAPELRREAGQVVRVLRTSAEAVVATVDQVRISIILMSLTDVIHERPELRLPALASIAAHDADHSKGYLATLRAFLDASGDVREASLVLGMHPNSVRYRLKRIGEISGLDLADRDTRLLLGLTFLALP